MPILVNLCQYVQNRRLQRKVIYNGIPEYSSLVESIAYFVVKHFKRRLYTYIERLK